MNPKIIYRKATKLVKGGKDSRTSPATIKQLAEVSSKKTKVFKTE